MRRPRIRTRKPSQHSWSSNDFMAVVPPSPTSTMSLRGRDTGFPGSFCGQRNTCLPHPDADLSPDACLTEDDITIARAAARHRMSFLVHRDRARALALADETTSRADSILPGRPPHNDDDEHALYCASPVILPDEDDGDRARWKVSAIGRLALTSLRGAELTRNLGDDAHPHRSSKDGDSLSSSASSPTHRPPASVEEPFGGGNSRRRRSFLRRLAHK